MTNQGTDAWTVWGGGSVGDRKRGIVGRPQSGLASMGQQLRIVSVGNNHGHCRGRIWKLLFHL